MLGFWTTGRVPLVTDESIRTDESVGSDDDLAKVNEQLSRAELYYNGHLAP